MGNDLQQQSDAEQALTPKDGFEIRLLSIFRRELELLSGADGISKEALHRAAERPGCKRPLLVRARIGQRAREGIKKAQAQGVHIGRAPFGFQHGAKGHLEKHDVQDAIVAEICDCFDGGMRFAEICRYLDRGGVPAPHGHTWHSATVREILKRRGRSRKQGNWDPDKALFLSQILRGDERSYRYIAKQLNRSGLTAKHGGPWHPSTVMELLKDSRVF